MSTDLKKGPGQSGKGGNQVAGQIGDKIERKHKVYDYKMTDRDRMALQTVQRAQSSLKVVNDAIKSGKPVKAELLQLCLQINAASVDMLFD